MSGTITMILPLIILFAVMYLLLIRPQKKREKEVNAMRSGVQVGDEIITIGGICGKIVKTKEESLVIQVGADKIKFEIMRWAVSRVVEEGKKRSSAKAKPDDYDVDDDDEVEVKKAKPKRMKKAAPVEEEPETEVPEAEVSEEAEEAVEAAEEPAEAVEAEAEPAEEEEK